MTKHPRTVPKVTRLILVHHLLHPMPRQDVPLMNQPIEEFSGRFNDGNIGDLERVFFGWFYVEDHLERFFVERNEGVETGKVEIVLDEIFAYFGKVLVTGKGAEPGDPGERLCA